MNSEIKQNAKAFALYIGALIIAASTVGIAGTYNWGAISGTSGGGSALDANSYVAPPTGCSPNEVFISSADGGQAMCARITINPDQSITFPDGTTLSGPSVSSMASKLNGLPDQAVSQATLKPIGPDAGTPGTETFVQNVIKATGGHTYNADAYYMPSGQCSLIVPNNQTVRFVIQWKLTKWTSPDAASNKTGNCELRRTYIADNINGTITVTTMLSETGLETGCAAGVNVDGGGGDAAGVVQPFVAGATGVYTNVECSIEQYDVTAN